MSYWLNNSVKNLLPLSKAADFESALSEWHFTGAVNDYEGEIKQVVCELCEHLDLALHYQIKNSITGKFLLVGSSCILKFDQIRVLDDFGNAIVDRSLRKAALESARRAQAIEKSLIPIRDLWPLELSKQNLIKFLVAEIKGGQGLAPRHLLFLLTGFELYGIPYMARLYKVNLRGEESGREVADMSEEDFLRIAPALSPEQSKKAHMLRNSA